MEEQHQMMVRKIDLNTEDSSEAETDTDGAQHNDCAVYSYEKLREKNMKDNAEFISKLCFSMENPKKTPRKKTKQILSVQRRKSLRLCNMNLSPGPKPEPEPEPESKEINKTQTDDAFKKCMERPELFHLDNNKQPQKYKIVCCIGSDITLSTEELKNKIWIKKQSGPLDMVENIVSGSGHQQMVNFFQHYSGISKHKVTKTADDLQCFIKEFGKISLNKNQVSKVVPERIFSIVIHPTESKVLVGAGSKWGNVGLWDVSSGNSQDSKVLYSPHTLPVNCLSFLPDYHNRLLSCSYDGTLRCIHFEKQVFDEVYSTQEEDVQLRNFDFLSPETTLVSQSDGYVATVDMRINSIKAVAKFLASSKSLRTVSIHPSQKQYFITAAADGNIVLWDCRYLKDKPCKIHMLQNSRMVDSAYFSPLTGKYILASTKTDKLNIYDSSSLNTAISLACSVSHNNQVGRWLTAFRALWHPAREDVFVVGSMTHPRKIELYNDKGKLLKNLYNPDYMTSISSLNTIHPTQNILAGGNASGKVFVFM